MNSGATQQIPQLIFQNADIDQEDLDYVEKDLSYWELVSLGFLLYGDDHVRSQYILQKLIVLYNAVPNGGSNLLREFSTINLKWKSILIEALAIIKAKRVLRKLGFYWEDISTVYLPHIPEFAVNINPVLKALYFLCKRMTPMKAGIMVNAINSVHKNPEENFRFYDFTYLEIFLLDWLSLKIIQIEKNYANLKVLLEHLKLHEEDTLRDLLLQTLDINFEEEIPQRLNEPREACKGLENRESDDLYCEINKNAHILDDGKVIENNESDCYSINKTTAGFILIINQKTFFEDSDAEIQHLLPPKKLRERKGTDVDKERLQTVFSSFGYKLLVYNNLTHVEILQRIREAMMLSFQYDSLIVAILSHGIDGCVYGCNSIPVKITDIEEVMSMDTLMDKPKMIIVQACQTAKICLPSKNDNNNNSCNNKYMNPTGYIDFIKAMSTVPGHSSIRHIETGSWFIQSLCDKVDKLADNTQISDILIAVTKDVSDKRGTKDEVMVPITNSTLRKHFFLPKRK